MTAIFNQEISPREVLKKISVAANGEPINIRPATEEEKSARIPAAKLAELLPKRSIAFRAVDLLPRDSLVTVTFESGLPSEEGALTSRAPQSFSFKTLGGLQLAKSHCSYDEAQKECESYQDWHIEFNNPLDAKSFDKSQIKIEPKIEKPKFSIYENEIVIEGYKKTRADYKVTVSQSLKDAFGQTLGNDVSVNFKTKAAEPSLYQEKQTAILLFSTRTPSRHFQFTRPITTI